MKDTVFQGFGYHRYKPLKAVESNGCEYQHLTPNGIDYCLKSNAWLCRGFLEQGRCPND